MQRKSVINGTCIRGFSRWDLLSSISWWLVRPDPSVGLTLALGGKQAPDQTGELPFFFFGVRVMSWLHVCCATYRASGLTSALMSWTNSGWTKRRSLSWLGGWWSRHLPG